MQSKKWWEEKFEDGTFLEGIFHSYLRRNKLWHSSYKEIMGVKFRLREMVFDPEYDEIDEDFIEVFILQDSNIAVREVIPFSKFLKWQESRSKHL